MIHTDLLNRLPEECREIRVLPRHTIAVKTFFMKTCIWIVNITNKPGDRDRAWRVEYSFWKTLCPKHGTRTDYIRAYVRPTITGTPKPRQLSLFE